MEGADPVTRFGPAVALDRGARTWRTNHPGADERVAAKAPPQKSGGHESDSTTTSSSIQCQPVSTFRRPCGKAATVRLPPELLLWAAPPRRAEQDSDSPGWRSDQFQTCSCRFHSWRIRAATEVFRRLAFAIHHSAHLEPEPHHLVSLRAAQVVIRPRSVRPAAWATPTGEPFRPTDQRRLWVVLDTRLAVDRLAPSGLAGFGLRHSSALRRRMNPCQENPAGRLGSQFMWMPWVEYRDRCPSRPGGIRCLPRFSPSTSASATPFCAGTNRNPATGDSER